MFFAKTHFYDYYILSPLKYQLNVYKIFNKGIVSLIVLSWYKLKEWA